MNKKILIQRVRELGINWDDAVPDAIRDVWSKWKSELPSLSAKGIPYYYAPKESNIVSTQLHGFYDASEDAYGGIVYLRLTDSKGEVHIISLVMPKTRFHRSSD